MSATAPLDPNESDPYILWAEIVRLRHAVKGPDGYASWQDAAVAERIRRVKAEAAIGATPEPVAWFVDGQEDYEARQGFKMPPHWIEVRPGDPMWSDRWKRYPLYRPASIGVPSLLSVGEKLHAAGGRLPPGASPGTNVHPTESDS